MTNRGIEGLVATYKAQIDALRFARLAKED